MSTSTNTDNFKVKVVTSDNKTFEIERKVAFVSKVIENVVQASSPDEVIKLDLVDGATMEKVLEFCEHYKDEAPLDIEKPLKSELIKAVPLWDYNFINIPNDELMRLIMAANYMDIVPLSILGCAQIASKIKGRPVEQIRKEFNIVNDFTPEEEAQVRRENKWCESSSS